MLFSVSGCGGGGSSASRFADTPISQDKPVPEPESNDIPITPEPSPQSQDKPVEPVPTPTPEPIISHDPFPEPVRYTVSFNSNGGSDVSSITVLSGNTINKPRNPKKHGSTFKGWYKDSALTQAFTFGTNGDKVTGNITLYAKWIEDRVLAEIAVERVSIGYQDGDSASHVTKNITLPHNIDVSGDTANIIWSSNNEKVIYTNGTVTRQSSDVTVVLTALSSIGTASKSRAFTLKVIHTQTPAVSSYTVSFNSNGGSSVSSITITSGNTVTQPANPSRSGYTFGGWYKDSALTQAFKFGSDGDKVTSNITLYAKWIETNILRAEAAIDKVSIGYQSGDSASNVTKNLTLPTSVNASGDVSISWSSNNPSIISNSGAVTRPSGSDTVVVLTAKATVGSVSRTKTFTVTVLHEATPTSSSYTVTFNSNGGSTIDSVNIPSGDTIEMPENPTRDDYVFIGWFKDEAFTEIFTFGTDGDKITQNITLYARWADPEELLANYALSEIIIGYSYGDNPNYVTGNITLPSVINTAGFYDIDSVNISWSSSNPSVISSTGSVTRQNGKDVNVTLKATIPTKTEVISRVFNLRVVRKTNRSLSEIPTVTVDDIAELNNGDSETNISYGDDKQVINIDGTFCGFQIYNAEDAKDAVQGIHEALGIYDTYSELIFSGATSMDMGVKYCFVQSYDNAEVYGRRILVSTNNNNRTNFMMSSFLSSDVLASSDLSAKITKKQAEEIAKGHYTGSFDVIADFTHQIIYSLNRYENAPVRAFAVKVLGVNVNGEYINEDVIVNALNGEIINTMSNHLNFRIPQSAENEFGKFVNFYTEYEPAPIADYCSTILLSNFMRDSETNVQIYKPWAVVKWTRDINFPDWLKKSGSKVAELFMIQTVRDNWNRYQVSAYTNMTDIMRWWKTTFHRNSLDNKGMKVKVVTHAVGMKNNAAWMRGLPVFGGERINIYENEEGSSYAHQPSAAADVLAHETTHAVLYYEISGGGWNYTAGNSIIPALNKFPYQNATGAIDEAYSDIFACIYDSKDEYGNEDWLHAEDWYGNNVYGRNIANPNDENAKDCRLDIQKYFTVGKAYNEYNTIDIKNAYDHNNVHKYSLIISHTAYLMHKYGMPYDILGKLWYSTIYYGAYDANSNFHSVRNVVLNAARENPNLRGYIKTIERAFDEVGIGEKEIYHTLNAIIVDTTNPDSNIGYVSLNISKDNEVHNWLPTNGSILLQEGTYHVSLADSVTYFPFSQDINITANMTLNVRLSHLPHISGIIYSSDRVTPLRSANVAIISGRDNPNGNIIESMITDAYGWYSFNLTNQNYGDYTIIISKGGQKFHVNVTLNGEVEKNLYFLSDNDEDVPILTPTSPDVSNNRYEIFNEAMTWHEAKTRCEELGGHLATITSEEEYNRILAMIPPNTYAWYWLGAKKDDNSGSWQWITGEPFIFTKWQDDEPNNQGETEQCLELTNNWYPYEDWGWNDENGDFTATGFVCEWDSMEGKSVSYDIPIDEAHFPDEAFRNYISINIDKDRNGILSKAEIENTTRIDVGGSAIIQSLNGIKYFTTLQTLHCYGNQLTTLDVSGCTALQTLRCQGNPLTTLDVSGCTALQTLYCYNNQFTTLDVNSCIALQTLYCFDNAQLTALDVSGCTALQTLYCYDNNQLKALDMNGCTALQTLRCYINQLTTLDVSTCTALQALECSFNLLKALDISKNTALQTLYCNNCLLTALDVSGCTALQTLDCRYNQLTTLDMSGCNALQILNCSRNQLKALDVNGCTTLQTLNCSHNQLKALNVNGCTTLQTLNCYENQLKALDVSKNTALITLDCRYNQLTTLDVSKNTALRDLHYDYEVIVTRSSSSTSTAFTTPASQSSSSATNDFSEILATLSAFTPSTSGTYTFTASLDRTPPEGSSLILLADSEDINGSFAFMGSPDVVRVSADFIAGRTYTPVIVAKTEQQEQSGGCHSGILGIVLLIVVLLRKRRS